MNPEMFHDASDTQPHDKNPVPSGSLEVSMGNKEKAVIEAENKLKEPMELDFDFPTSEEFYSLMVEHSLQALV